MRKYGFPKKLLSVFVIALLMFTFSSCGEPVEYVDEDANKMPDFNYIIFPLLDQAEYIYCKIFSSVEYGNKTTTSDNGTVYYFVEPSEYESDSFEALIRGTFTQVYAEEYIEMMFGGDNPLYIEQDGYLYVNPDKLIEFEVNEYNTENCVVKNYNGIYASLTVSDIDGVSYDYNVSSVDGLWYLDAMIGQDLNNL